MADPSADKRPLDEVMLAMDVVDTLRHRQLLVERELASGERDTKLIDRLKEIYAAQGIEVPDRILAEGVAALREDRFAYQPPPPSLAVSLARVYVTRAEWGWPTLIGVAFVVVLYLAYSVFVSGPHERRLEEIPKALASQRDAVVTAARVDEAAARARELYGRGVAALREGEVDAAEDVVARLQELRRKLEQEYVLRIVSRPNERSAIWRVPDINPNARNFYLIVEAVAPSGEVLSIAVSNEEDGRVETVTKWGLRVDESVYRRIAADKQDDGIIQDRLVGRKRRGYLTPEYSVSTTGAQITEW